MKRDIKVILLESIPGVGNSGDEAKVKPGFARNYLFPMQKALAWTPENLKIFDQRRAQIEAAEQMRLGRAEEIVASLKSLTIAAHATAAGQLYGSVGPREIAAAATELGMEIKRSHVLISEPLRQLGEFEVSIRPHPDVGGELQVRIVAQE